MRKPNTFLDWHKPANYRRCIPKPLSESPVFASRDGDNVTVEFRADNGHRVEFTLTMDDAYLLMSHIHDALGKAHKPDGLG